MNTPFAREKEQPERRIYFGVPRDEKKPLGFVSFSEAEVA